MLPRRTFEARFREKVAFHGPDDCWNWTAAFDRHGYGRIGKDGGTVSAHRASWEIHNGAIPVGLGVLHRCDTPSCVNPRHLFLGTQTDNMHDMHQKKRGKMPVAVRRFGERNGASKLDVGDVEKIRALAGVEPQRAVAAKFNISPAQVCRIQTGKRWPNASA